MKLFSIAGSEVKEEDFSNGDTGREPIWYPLGVEVEFFGGLA